ncbi:hypothetical protein T11_2111 [Trichinella zimbabwensis]|uniref:Uncharacterized protein n=1 Tax=Trichinella zimbabwensis TaxID=268475 RepID=A0A0V1I5X6_9BILA|nr:hypothetical protein T11_2111 [Trichinella zimbabwensis]
MYKGQLSFANGVTGPSHACLLRHQNSQPPVTVADADGQARTKGVLNKEYCDLMEF